MALSSPVRPSGTRAIASLETRSRSRSPLDVYRGLRSPNAPLLGLHLLANQFPPLHGLRALAIASVLQVHVTLTLQIVGLVRADPPLFVASRRIWFGMDLFFILSGFLIGTLLLPPEDGRARPSVLRFYLRRAFRIVPLYYVVLTALALLSPTLPWQRAGLPYEFAYLTNYVKFPIPPVMPWAWSLCVEEHFYVAVPIIALALARTPGPRWRIGALFALWVAGLACRYAVFATRAGPWAADQMTSALYLPTHARFDILVAGMLLAYVQRYHGGRLRRALRRRGLKWALTAVPMVCCWALLGPLADRHDIRTVFAWGTVTSVMYFSLVLLLLNSDGLVTRFLSSPWFLRFATLGYGIYLVHPPLIAYVVVPLEAVMILRWNLPVALTWACGLSLLLVIATAVAYGLHLLIEKPALWVRDRLAR